MVCVTMADDSSEATAIKKPYSAPRLEVYGGVNLITRATASGSKNDHGGGKVKTN
jgi:hypothetical protein